MAGSAGWNAQNGNLAGQWDIEKRPMTQGSTFYVYDPWGRRIWKQYNGTSGEAYFYGVTGQKLETYNCTVGSNGVSGTLEGINTYFVGRMISEKGVVVATDRLGSVRGDNNGVAMSYFPWGEERGAGTADNRTKFAGYYRDMPGQDYANARYYTAVSGSFWSPDPTPNNWDSAKPSSWNLYSYTNGDPVNLTDPDGTDCASSALEGFTGIPSGTAIGSLIASNSDLDVYAETIFAEASIGSDENAANEKAAIAAVISNRWQFVNGFYTLHTKPVGTRGSDKVRVTPDWGKADGTIASIVWASGQFAVWGSPGQLARSAQRNLNAALNSAYNSIECTSLVQAIATAAGFMSVLGEHDLEVSANGVIFTSFGSGGGANKSYYETTIGSYGNSPNVFYGVTMSQVGLPAPTAPTPTPRRPPGSKD